MAIVLDDFLWQHQTPQHPPQHSGTYWQHAPGSFEQNPKGVWSQVWYLWVNASLMSLQNQHWLKKLILCLSLGPGSSSCRGASGAAVGACVSTRSMDTHLGLALVACFNGFWVYWVYIFQLWFDTSRLHVKGIALRFCLDWTNTSPFSSWALNLSTLFQYFSLFVTLITCEPKRPE